MTHGALPLIEGHHRLGADRSTTRPPRVRHRLTDDGLVELLGGGRCLVMTDVEARRLAWALLNDLAPDEVVPAAEVVTYKEGQRLAVLRAVAAGARTCKQVGDDLGWSLRTSQRRMDELIGDGRLRRLKRWPVTVELAVA